MSAAAFDTLRLARALRDKAHLTAEQAEGFADAISEALQSDLATKVDLEGQTAALRSDTREAALRLEAKIEAAKADITKWVAGAIGFQMIVVVGAIIALARSLHS